MGENVVREHNGDWWYVVGPGLDEPLLAVKRGFSGMANATQLWLPVVSDDRGQLIAIADSGGQLQGALIGPQYDAGLWNSSGLTSHAQSFNPRRWATPGGIDTISTFRSRQYDPATGKWLQEDPMGTASPLSVGTDAPAVMKKASRSGVAMPAWGLVAKHYADAIQNLIHMTGWKRPYPLDQRGTVDGRDLRSVDDHGAPKARLRPRWITKIRPPDLALPQLYHSVRSNTRRAAQR